MKKKGHIRGTAEAEGVIKAFDMLKAVNDDGKAEINGRTYVLTKTVHKKRRKIFGFYTKCQAQIIASDYSFLDSVEFESVENLINNIVTFNGDLISRLPNHWEDYPEDYILFVVTMLGAISYPFLIGVVGV